MSQTADKPDIQPVAMDAEQAADFAALQAAAADGAPVPGTDAAAVAETAQQAIALDQELSSMLQMITAMLKPVLPSVAAIYTPQTCEQVGASVAAVCNKHGWLQGGIGGEYAEEIMCLCVVGPLAVSTAMAAKVDIARIKEAAKKREQEQKAALEAKGIQPPEPAQVDK